MAQEEQERKTFKWGDQEYLLDDLLKLHAEHENNFYNFAKERGKYDSEALSGLRQAIGKRVEAVKSGKAFDADGVLDTDTTDNISIQTQKKGLFRKEKYVDQDNTEWAKYYFNKLVKQLKPHDKKAKASAWDMNKHGLAAYLTGQGLTARDVFEKWDLRDENNPKAKRSFDQRRKLLKDHLSKYKTWLSGKGFDFTKNDNEWDDNFGKDLDEFIANYDSSDINTLTAALRKFGAGDDYTLAFTSDKWDFSGKDSDSKKTNEEKEAQLKAQRLKEMQDEVLKDYTRGDGEYVDVIDYSNHEFKDGVDKSFMNYYSNLNSQEQKKYGTYLGADNKSWDAAYKKLMESLKNNTAYDDKNKGIILQRYFENAPNGFTDLGDGTYLVNDSVNNTGIGYIYDPKSGFLQKRHISEFANDNTNIKNHYQRLLYDLINAKYNTDYNNRQYVQFDEQGGVIKAQLGSAILKPYNVDTQYEEEGALKGITAKTQKAKNNYIDPDNKSAANEATGFDGKAKARIGYAIADLTSAIAAFVPGAGTAISAAFGLGSTFGNFFTDMADDAVTAGEMWKNFGMNLGMDALGLIPGGGAASKMGKIVKGLKTVVPAMIALPGVSSMLANSPEIAASWKKAFDGDPENGGSKMTYQDYMNILQVLNVAAGGVNIARNTYKSATKSTVNSNKLAVEVTDKAGNRKALVLEGDDVDNFKAANNEGKAQEFIDKIEGGNNYKIVEETSFNKGKFWGRGADDKLHLFHQNPLGRTGTGSARIHEVRSQQAKFKTGSNKGKPKTAGKNKKPVMEDYVSTGLFGGSDIMGKNVINMSSKPKLDDFKTKQQQLVDTEIAALRANAKAYADAKKQNDLDISAIESKIGRANNKMSETTDQHTRYTEIIDDNTKLIANRAALKPERVKKAALEAELKSLKADLNTATTAGDNKAIKSLKRQIKKKQAELNSQNQTIADLRTSIKELETKTGSKNKTIASRAIKDAQTTSNILNVQRARLQNILNNLTAQKSGLTSRYTTNSADFDALLNNYPKKVKFNDVEYSFGPETAFTRQGLLDEGLYKQGGSINRNKINKFLNYGKR